MNGLLDLQRSLLLFSDRIIGSADVEITRQEEMFVYFRAFFKNFLGQPRDTHKNPRF